MWKRLSGTIINTVYLLLGLGSAGFVLPSALFRLARHIPGSTWTVKIARRCQYYVFNLKDWFWFESLFNPIWSGNIRIAIPVVSREWKVSILISVWIGDLAVKWRKKNTLSGVNPRYVLRNWMAESAIRRAETNDFSEVVCFLTSSLNVRRRKTPHWLSGFRSFTGRSAAPGLVFSISHTRSSRGGRLRSETANVGWALESELFILNCEKHGAVESGGMAFFIHLNKVNSPPLPLLLTKDL